MVNIKIKKAFSNFAQKLYDSNQFQEKLQKAQKELSNCLLCPRNCSVDRLKNVKGFSELKKSKRSL